MPIATHKKAHYNIPVAFLLLSRFVSEIINSFVWKSANYVWSIIALIYIAVLLWPLIVLNKPMKGNIFIKYAPIFVYLLYLSLRLQFFELYSLKCFLSEFIVWFIFIFVAEFASYDIGVIYTVRILMMRFVKILVIIGIFQIAFLIWKYNIFNPLIIFNCRPVKGIFDHSNIFCITVLPFLFYFLKERAYFWCFFLLLACLGTGTRSPFLGSLCLAILVFKSVLGRKISWANIFVTLCIIVVVYFSIIAICSIPIEYQTFDQSNLSSLHWRVDFWKNFYRFEGVLTVFFGRGLGSACKYAGTLVNETLFSVHNDWLLIYYDAGVIGILLFLNLILFIFRLIKKITTTSNDYVLLMYLLIVCFYITDNFIFFTHSIFVYVFIASFLSFRNKPIAISTYGGWKQSSKGSINLD